MHFGDKMAIIIYYTGSAIDFSVDGMYKDYRCSLIFTSSVEHLMVDIEVRNGKIVLTLHRDEDETFTIRDSSILTLVESLY
jgi:hypothetical protein